MIFASFGILWSGATVVSFLVFGFAKGTTFAWLVLTVIADILAIIAASQVLRGYQGLSDFLRAPPVVQAGQSVVFVQMPQQAFGQPMHFSQAQMGQPVHFSQVHMGQPMVYGHYGVQQPNYYPSMGQPPQPLPFVYPNGGQQQQQFAQHHYTGSPVTHLGGPAGFPYVGNPMQKAVNAPAPPTLESDPAPATPLDPSTDPVPSDTLAIPPQRTRPPEVQRITKRIIIKSFEADSPRLARLSPGVSAAPVSGAEVQAAVQMLAAVRSEGGPITSAAPTAGERE